MAHSGSDKGSHAMLQKCKILPVLFYYFFVTLSNYFHQKSITYMNCASKLGYKYCFPTKPVTRHHGSRHLTREARSQN